jgi:hypothetical protein
MGEATPKFPVTYFSRESSLWPWKKAVIKEYVCKDVTELEQDLEWIDTRGDSTTWIVDADGQLFDVKLNHLMGEPTEFFARDRI